MLELRTLGALDLRDDAGRELRAVLQQPKRLALMAYLAIAAPDRYVRRDLLLGLFWPELDQEHARAALRRALYFLRKTVGNEVLDGRGDEEVGIRSGAIRCDATEFVRALDRGRPAQALELYRGPLLAGFYIAGAPEAERWLDETRSHLSRRAAAAAWALAEEPGRDPAGKADYARFAASLMPDDEDSVRRLLQLLEQSGDRGGALRAFEDHVRRLRLDFEAEPSPALVALVESIRLRDAKAGRAAPVKPDLVGILPFTVRGDPALEYLGEGLVDLLSVALDVGELRPVDPRAILAAVAGRPAAGVSDAELADRLGARYCLRGSVVASGGLIRITATLADRHGVVRSRAEAQGAGEAELFELVDELVRQLLTRREAGPGQRLARIAGLMTGSLPALRAWLQGEHEFRLGRYLPALEAYQQAAGLDQSFALAHYRVAAAAAASALIGPAREAAALALRHRDRLSDRDRLLVEAQHAWLGGATDEAERRYTAVVAAHPDDLEAWFLLGDLLLHNNPYRGRSIREAREPLQRALALDPEHLSTLVKLARLDALERRPGQLAERVDRILELSPASDQALGMRALRAFALRQPEGRRQVALELRAAPALTIAIAFTDVVLYGGDLAGAADLGRELTDVVRSPELRALCHLVLAHLGAAAGRLQDAAHDLARAEAFDRPWGLEVRGLLVALPFLPWPGEMVQETRSLLSAWEPEPSAANVSLPLAFHNGLHPQLRMYALGLLAAREGDTAGVTEAAEQLAELPVPDDAAVLVERMERSLAAERWLLKGEPGRALESLAGARTELWFQYAVASPFFADTFGRWRRADLLRRLGRTEEAAGWFGALAERSPWELPFAASSRE